jgi:hypothetical protein
MLRVEALEGELKYKEAILAAGNLLEMFEVCFQHIFFPLQALQHLHDEFFHEGFTMEVFPESNQAFYEFLDLSLIAYLNAVVFLDLLKIQRAI